VLAFLAKQSHNVILLRFRNWLRTEHLAPPTSANEVEAYVTVLKQTMVAIALSALLLLVLWLLAGFHQ
jgi:hypothetical protein